MPIPASALIPPAFHASKPEWHFKPSDVPEDGSAKLFLTSEITAGWRYYTLNRQVKLSKDYPADFAADIGYKYGHGPDKGPDKQEKASPTGIWLVRAWLVEKERMVAFIIDSFTLQGQLEKIFKNDEFQMLDTSITNFYLEIFNDKNPATPANKYSATGNLRVLKNRKAAVEAAKPWFPDNFFRGLNPLEAPTEPPSAPADPSLPATRRDEDGADHEVAIHKEGDSYEW
jgi:hypothetical protein